MIFFDFFINNLNFKNKIEMIFFSIKYLKTFKMEIVYKSYQEYIIKLQKLSDTITDEDRDIFKTNSHTNKLKARYKANKLLVLDIYHKFTGEKKEKIVEFINLSLSYIFEKGKITITNYGKEDGESYEFIDYFLEEDLARYMKFNKYPYNVTTKKMKLYNKHGILRYEGGFTHSQREGHWIKYYNNGTIRLEGNYYIHK